MDEEVISRGLRKALYDLARQSPTDLAGWASLMLPLLDRIAADERVWFVAQADDFVRVYANLGEPGQVVGQVLRFDLTTCHEPHTIFWGLEQAIERNGRMPERGLRFNTPYAIATWRRTGRCFRCRWRDRGSIGDQPLARRRCDPDSTALPD